MRGRIGDDPVPPRAVGTRPAEPAPLVHQPQEVTVWKCSDSTTKNSAGEAQRHEVKLAFQKLVQPYDMAGRHAEQPIPLPNGVRDRDDLWRWIEEHGHAFFPWLGVYVSTHIPPSRSKGVPVDG